MSKLVKKLVERDIANRLEGVSDAVVVNCIGLDGDQTYSLRKTFREKGISMLVVKRSLAARATANSPINPAFTDVAGSIAVVWGGEDFVSLAKEVVAIDKLPEFENFEIKGGVMDEEALDADEVKAISKWPSRQEQISMLVGQILSPGSNLVGQLSGPGGQLAGQVEKIIENQE